jgi:O-acetylhomoserine/O-acetylserine sulfhydrylase-like pyridoxal-dependent enzyme
VATSSGQAAQFLAIATLITGPGDNIVSAPTLYGGTYTQVSTYGYVYLAIFLITITNS